VDDKDFRIQQLERENERLSAENAIQKKKIEDLTARLLAMEAKLAALEAKIARLTRDSSTSSKPPSSDIVKPPPSGTSGKQQKRSVGGQPGHTRHERTAFPPERVDRVITYELTREEAKGLRVLKAWSVVQQADLVESPITVTEHRARKYVDSRTGSVVYASMPVEIRGAGLIGPKLAALVGFLKSKCHVSYACIQEFLQEVLQIPVCCGQLAKVVQKISDALEQPYVELREVLPTQARLGVDETGHPEAGKNLWAWCFRADDFTVFHIDPSRGSQVLRAILTEAFGGVIGCDFFSAYRKYMREAPVIVQFCMAHLIREIRFLTEHPDKVLVHWGRKLLACMRALFKAIHARERLGDAVYFRRAHRIRKKFLGIARHPPSRGEAYTLAQRFKGEGADCYFTFLTVPGVEPTNNLTEQMIRPLVIDQRITQGTRSKAGRRWCERIWTAIASCRQQGRSVFKYLVAAVDAHLHRQAAPSLLPAKP
jgi:transposase